MTGEKREWSKEMLGFRRRKGRKLLEKVDKTKRFLEKKRPN